MHSLAATTDRSHQQTKQGPIVRKREQLGVVVMAASCRFDSDVNVGMYSHSADIAIFPVMSSNESKQGLLESLCLLEELRFCRL